jgi:hypothetical protein
MNLLTTYTQHSELQEITALSLIPTLYKSPQRPLSFFQPAVSSSVVPWQRLLTVEIFQLHALRFVLYRLPCRTSSHLNLYQVTTVASSLHSLPRRAQLTGCTNSLIFITPRRGPRRQHPPFSQFHA